MKRTIRVLGIAVAVLLTLVRVSTALAARDPLVGSWQSTDIDGSYQILTIGGGPGSSHYVRYYDFGATICDVTPGALEFAASASGVLTGSGDELAGTLPVYCQYRPPEYWGDHYFQFTYDASTDTLSDGSIVWYRR